MKTMNRLGRLALLVFFIFVFFWGCGTLNKESLVQEEPGQVQELEKSEISIYYDFKDVPVPKELGLERKNSFVIQTNQYTSGLLAFSGDVEIDSLISFFKNKMLEEGWRFLSSFKSPKSLIFFQKEKRFCLITVERGTFTTRTEILIIPLNQGSAGRS